MYIKDIENALGGSRWDATKATNWLLCLKFLCDSSLKCHYRVRPLHTMPETFESATIASYFGFVFEENSDREITWFWWCPRVWKFCSAHTKNEKPAFSNSCGLQSVFEKLRFREGLVYTLGLTIEIKLRFQISIGALRKTRKQRQREHHQTEALMSRTMAVHVHFNSWYISLPSSANKRERTNFLVFFWQRDRLRTANFSYFYLELNAFVAYSAEESLNTDKHTEQI